MGTAEGVSGGVAPLPGSSTAWAWVTDISREPPLTCKSHVDGLDVQKRGGTVLGLSRGVETSDAEEAESALHTVPP